jgi:hypothetical protein
LKLPDFLDDERAGTNTAVEMSALAYELVRELGLGVQQRLQQLDRPELADVQQRLAASLEPGPEPLVAKRALLSELDAALAGLRQLTGQPYPAVPA